MLSFRVRQHSISQTVHSGQILLTAGQLSLGRAWTLVSMIHLGKGALQHIYQFQSPHRLQFSALLVPANTILNKTAREWCLCKLPYLEKKIVFNIISRKCCHCSFNFLSKIPSLITTRSRRTVNISEEVSLKRWGLEGPLQCWALPWLFKWPELQSIGDNKACYGKLCAHHQ